jgi:hypothetical protein
MTDFLLDVIAPLFDGFAWLVAGAFGATLAERRRNRRLNGAKAECVECPHATAPKPLNEAMRAAKGHREATGHRCMIVAA